MANLVNADRNYIENTDVVDRKTLFQPLAGLLEQHIRVASPKDLWLLAWLHLHCGNKSRALEITEMGVERDPTNSYCARLLERLRSSG